MYFKGKYACIFYLTYFYWLPDVPISVVVLVSIINDVYRINCPMLVGDKKGRLPIASKSVVALRKKKKKKQCVLLDDI